MTEIYELSTDDVLTLAELLMTADLQHKEVKVTMQGGLKVKVGGGMWTPPLGEVVDNG